MITTQQKTLKSGYRKSYLLTTDTPSKRGERRFLRMISQQSEGHLFEKTVDVAGVRNYLLNFGGVVVECDAYCPKTRTITEIKMKNMASAKGNAALIMALSHLTGAGVKKVICITANERLECDDTFYTEHHLKKGIMLIERSKRGQFS